MENEQAVEILTKFNQALIRGKTGLPEGCWDQLSEAVDKGIVALGGVDCVTLDDEAETE